MNPIQLSNWLLEDDDLPQDLAGWLDAPPESVHKNLTLIIKHIGDDLDTTPKNIDIQFDRKIIYPPNEDAYSRLFISFDSQVDRETELLFGSILGPHVSREMAKAGYTVPVNSWFISENSCKGRPRYCWLVDRKATQQ